MYIINAIVPFSRGEYKMIRGKILQTETTDFIIPGASCPRCKGVFQASMQRSVQTGYIFSIPFMKMTVQRYTRCPHCGIIYSFSPRVYKQIKKVPSPSLLFRECGQTLLRQRKIYDRYSRPSKKKSRIAALLAFFLGVLGLQNIYMGHLKRFAINGFLVLAAILLFRLALSQGSVLIVFCTLCITANIYWGLIDTVRILSGHAKDVKGHYLMTRRQYQKRMAYRAGLY